MFSYIMLGTNDLPRAIKFYDPLMALLGHVKAGRNEQGGVLGHLQRQSHLRAVRGRSF